MENKEFTKHLEDIFSRVLGEKVELPKSDKAPVNLSKLYYKISLAVWEETNELPDGPNPPYEELSKSANDAIFNLLGFFIQNPDKSAQDAFRLLTKNDPQKASMSTQILYEIANVLVSLFRDSVRDHASLKG